MNYLKHYINLIKQANCRDIPLGYVRDISLLGIKQ